MIYCLVVVCSLCVVSLAGLFISELMNLLKKSTEVQTLGVIRIQL